MLRESSTMTPEEVLLGDRGAQDERRPEQADDEDGQHAEPERDEHQALARRSLRS